MFSLKKREFHLQYSVIIDKLLDAICSPGSNIYTGNNMDNRSIHPLLSIIYVFTSRNIFFPLNVFCGQVEK